MVELVRSSTDAISIWQAGVASVVAQDLVSRTIQVADNDLVCNDWSIDLRTIGEIAVVGGGKATAAMAAGLERSLGEFIGASHELSGWINIPAGTEQPLRSIHSHVARPAGLNEPTELAVEGTQQILKTVRTLQPKDLCIALISGGGSALLPAPRAGISLEEKLAVTRWLSGAGANIQQLNTVRKHLSDIKGGRLLSSCQAGHLLTLVISDVLGDPLDVIASGPTIPDASTADEALKILGEFDPDCELPSSIYGVLNTPRGEAKRPTACQHHIEVIGNNALAVDEAGICAERLGYSHAMQSATACEGAAEEVGRHLAKMSLQMLRYPGPDCLISGGEPIVKLTPPDRRGLGGRNQQLVLAALGFLIDEGDVSNDERKRFAILSGGTDGEDGPTDAAGAIVDAKVWARAEQLGLDWRDHLARNDAYTFFEACGGLIKTGPTNTNVCDLRVIAIRK